MSLIVLLLCFLIFVFELRCICLISKKNRVKIFSVAAIPEFHFLQYIFFFRFEFILSLTQKHLYKNLASDEKKPKEDSVVIFHISRSEK